MISDKLAIDFSDGYLTILGSSGKRNNLELKDLYIKFCKTFDQEVVVEEILAYIEREELDSPVCYVGLDSRSVLMKSFYFPFRSAVKIDSAIEFELESSLPVSSDSLASEWIYGPRVGSGTFALAGCIEKKMLDQISSCFRGLGLRLAEIVDSSSSLVKCLQEPAAGNVLVIDLGQDRTVILSYGKGVLQNREMLLKGTGSVVDTLIRKGMTYDQAYRLLNLSDFTQEELDKEALPVLEGLERLISQVNNYVQLYAEKSDYVPDSIQVCGEGCEIKGIDRIVEKQLGVQTGRILPRGLLSRFEDVIEVNGAVRPYALLLPDKAEKLIFLQEEDKEAQAGRAQIIKYALNWAAVLVFSLLMFFSSNLIYKNKVINETEAQIDSILQKALPGVQGGLAHAQYMSIMKSRINSLKQQLATKSGGVSSAIEVMRIIHASAGKGLPIVVSEFTLDPRRAALTGTADNFKNVETFRTRLGNSNFFKTVKIKGASAVKKTNKVRFTIELLRKDSGERGD